MIKNALEIMGRIAVFRNKETEPGVPSTTGGVTLDLDSGSGIKSSPSIEHNGETIHGSEFPTRLYASHREASGSFSQKRAKPDFMALVLSRFFGQCTSTLVGTTAYEHEITPVSGLDLGSFTAIQRKGSDIFSERISGNYIEAFTLDLGDGWVSLNADIVGTGTREVNYEHEVVSAPANSLSIILAANGVEGSGAAERLANMYRVRAKDVGSEVWEVLNVNSVTGSVPAMIQFAGSVGSSSSDVDFHVDYIPVEPSWCTLPATVDESPLRLVDAKVVVDGWYNGSTLEGGEELSAEVMGFSISGKNNLELKHYPGDSGPAARALRGGRELSISLSESLRNSVRQYQADNPESEHLCLALTIEGAEIDPGGGDYFGAKLIFPQCGIIESPVVVQGKRLAQAGDLVVMDDGVYGGVIVRCYNQQTSYN